MGWFIVALIIFAIIIFALVGFFNFLAWIFSSPKKVQTPAVAPVATPVAVRPTLQDDVQAARRLIKHLRWNKTIGDPAYSKLLGYLDNWFPDSAKNLATIQPAPSTSATVEPQVPIVTIKPESAFGELATPMPTVQAVSLQPLNHPASEKVKPAAAPKSQADRIEASSVPQKVAPWELPDPVPAQPLIPRRSFGELMSGFMQEKNMRWGELTSGILIVLSAVGLVVSLREELRNTIPYFSALLFMLITAAIHGAGIYTLKKWKLRNTSRGTLVIGLLLVPLNFVAACVLSEQRALDDIWLWTAIVIGLATFSLMTWWSSKHLLRRGQLPMTLTIMGCGVSTLILNRTIGTTTSSLSYLVFSLPVLASFLIGSCWFDGNQWVRKRWTSRACNRAFLFLGISTFATVAALSLVLVRAESKLLGAVSLTPIISVCCIVVSWIGSVVLNSQARSAANENRLAGLSLKILGLILLLISLVSSISHPTIFAINSIVSAVGMLAAFIHQRDERLVPIAWATLAFGILGAVNLLFGAFKFDQWTSMSELFSALVNGKSGLCLLLVGCGVVIGNSVLLDCLQRNNVRLKAPAAFRVSGWITGGVVFAVGCLIALVASIVNRYNTFDVMTAGGLLLLAAIGLIVVTAIADRKGIAKAVNLPHFAAVVLLGALTHILWWNPQVATWFQSFVLVANFNWVAVFAIHSLVLVGVGVYLNRSNRFRLGEGTEGKSGPSASGFFTDWGALSALFLSLGAITMIQFQTGWATAFSGLACLLWLMIGWTWTRAFAAAPLIFFSAVFTCVATAEMVSKAAWCPAIDTAQHWLVQLVALSALSIIWSVMLAVFERRPRLKWLSSTSLQMDQFILFLLVAVAGCFTIETVFHSVVGELSSSSTLTSVLELNESPRWLIASMFAIGLAVFVSMFVKPNSNKGVVLVVVWMLAWALGASFFADSNSVASALRWLLPVGGLLAAVGMAMRNSFYPVLSSARTSLCLVESGPKEWSTKSTQQLINLALAIVAFVVLLVSTLTVSQVLLKGVESLGGPAADSIFRRVSAEVSFGVPIAIVVGTFLLYAISEQRRWLATIGSAVFQYLVLLSVVLLFISPYPQLASARFVNILKAVSLGMTAYGFVWFLFRERIEGQGSNVSSKPWLSWREKQISQIEVHTLINGLLITSLAALAIGRFLFVPDQPGDWISSVGSPLSALALASFGFLAFFIWRQGVGASQVSQTPTQTTWVWLAGWMGLVLVGLGASVVDRSFAAAVDFVPWLPFRVVMIGTVVVGLATTGLIAWFKRLSNGSTDKSLVWPVLASFAIALAFAIRGMLFDTAGFWPYFDVVIVLGVLASAVGLLVRVGTMSFVSAAVVIIGIVFLVSKNPGNWFEHELTDWLNVVTAVTGLIALAWSASYLFGNKRLAKTRLNAIAESDKTSSPYVISSMPRSFLWLTNVVLLLGSIWLLMAVGLQNWIGIGELANLPGVAVCVAMLGLSVISLWNEPTRFRVFGWVSLSLSVAILVAAQFASTFQWDAVSMMLAGAITVAMWGVIWLNRQSVFRLGQQLGTGPMTKLEDSMRFQLPIYSLAVGGVALLLALVVIFQIDDQLQRYSAAVVPFAFAFGLGAQSNVNDRRWLQVCTLCLVTIGVLFLAWADLTPAQMTELPMMRLMIRSLIVLAGGMFVYGGLVTRWVRDGDTWLKSLREMAVTTCGLAIGCLLLVLISEFNSFTEGVGCDVAFAESATVAVLVIGMIVGLIVIALRPENDPFALSLQGRMGYVYAAEFVGVALIAHLYFTIPFLFQIGIKAYWPYLMMALCFGGVGVASVLENRKLTVLGKPLFHTAVALPLLVALAIFAVDSKAQPELVMMSVGLAYLMVSYMHKSLMSGLAAIMFGNVALWMLFNRAEFSFFDHPQLWLIPPAVSTLIAGQLSRASMSVKQLSFLRYICIVVIYLSSTMEIFISGIGEGLWPPVVLAILAVIGIMSGIMFRVKAFLYFGSLFLLMAMVTMVSHAHQRLEHVWPWWAFGIGLGIAILVMFGLFEKKKNEMKAIADNLKQWE